jgi:hypothetical protein
MCGSRLHWTKPEIVALMQQLCTGLQLDPAYGESLAVRNGPPHCDTTVLVPSIPSPTTDTGMRLKSHAMGRLVLTPAT